MKALGVLFATMVVAGSIVTKTIPASAQTKECDSTLSEVLEGITAKGAIIASVERRDAGSYDANPFPSSEHLVVALEGSGEPSTNPKKAAQAAQNILTSPSLNLSWAKQIMASCPDIAIVGFGMWRTGWQNMFYRFRDGQVRPKVCTTELGPSGSWGIGWCD
jgi:hypothetical protein